MISPSSALALIAPGDSMDITQVHAELAWIESRALDAGNSQGDTMAGPLTVPGLVLGGVSVSTNGMFYFGSDTGSVNNLAVTTSFPSTMAKGQVIAVKVGNTNTGSATLNVNSLGAYTILQAGIQLSGGELPAGGWVLLEFDGSYWNVLGMAPGGNPNGTIGANTVNASTINATTWTGEWASMPSGTQAVFFQATAPPGWTQNTSVNDQVLRVVSGSGGGTGGSWDNSTGLSVGSHSHYFDHQHDLPLGGGAGGNGFSQTEDQNYPFGSGQSIYTGNAWSAENNGGGKTYVSQRSSYITVNASGIGGPNTGNTQPGISSNSSWRPAYINVIVCSKN